jgi:inhibitor of KinA
MQLDDISGVRQTVQVCYEGAFAPDLETVATATGLSNETVINAHLAGDFQVLMYGFSPGYAYLSGVPKKIQVPRKPAPVRDVPAGSVIIAGPQCLVTTLMMPTGWSIIGRSPTRVLTGNPGRPFLFDVGDQVTFERIDSATFASLSKGVAHE